MDMSQIFGSNVIWTD